MSTQTRILGTALLAMACIIAVSGATSTPAQTANAICKGISCPQPQYLTCSYWNWNFQVPGTATCGQSPWSLYVASLNPQFETMVVTLSYGSKVVYSGTQSYNFAYTYGNAYIAVDNNCGSCWSNTVANLTITGKYPNPRYR